MKTLSIAAAAAVAIGLTAVGAHGQTAPAQQLGPSIRAFAIPTLEQLGRDLYQQDREAWIATDLVRAKIDLEAGGYAGWIVAPRGDDDVVKFVRQGATGLEAGYEVAFGPGLEPKAYPSDDPKLSADELARYAAVETALKSTDHRCADAAYNPVVLPDPEQPGWLVWLLTPMTEARNFPITGHWRISVTPDGKTVRQRDRLYVGCLSGATPKDAKAIMVSQVVAPTPIETHVFVSYEARLPVFVATPDNTLWVVADGRIKPAPPTPDRGK